MSIKSAVLNGNAKPVSFVLALTLCTMPSSGMVNSYSRTTIVRGAEAEPHVPPAQLAGGVPQRGLRRRGVEGESVAIREPLPREALALAPTAEPLVPGAPRLLEYQQQTTEVAADAEVVEVPAYTPAERGVLLLDRLVPVAPAEIGEGHLRPLQSRLSGPEALPPAPFPGLLPQQREAQKIEGPLFLPLAIPLSGEAHHSGLLLI